MRILLFILYCLFCLNGWSQDDRQYLNSPNFRIGHICDNSRHVSKKGIHISVQGNKDLGAISIISNKSGNFQIPSLIGNDSIKFILVYKKTKITTKFYPIRLFGGGGEMQIGFITNFRKVLMQVEENENMELDLLNRNNLFYYVITNEYIKQKFDDDQKIQSLTYFVVKPNVRGTGGIFYDYTFK